MELMRLFYPNHPPATISALLGDRIGVLRKTPKGSNKRCSHGMKKPPRSNGRRRRTLKLGIRRRALSVRIASYSTSRGTITGYSWRPPQNWCHPYQICRHRHGALENQCLGSNGGGRVAHRRATQRPQSARSRHSSSRHAVIRAAASHRTADLHARTALELLQNRTNRADLFNSTRYGSKRWCDMTKSDTIARVAAIFVLEAAGKRERKIKRQK